MNVIKSLLAVAVVACSAHVSAQFVYTPDFPVKKAAKILNAEQKAPAAEAASKTAA
ncbi:hypothetical protein GCM10023345_22820 [Acinetobacter kookii]